MKNMRCSTLIPLQLDLPCLQVSQLQTQGCSFCPATWFYMVILGILGYTDIISKVIAINALIDETRLGFTDSNTHGVKGNSTKKC